MYMSTGSCSQQAREGERAWIVSAQIYCTQVFSGEITRIISPTDKSYCTEASPMAQEGTESYQERGSSIQKSRCAQAAWEKRS